MKNSMGLGRSVLIAYQNIKAENKIYTEIAHAQVQGLYMVCDNHTEQVWFSHRKKCNQKG